MWELGDFLGSRMEVRESHLKQPDRGCRRAPDDLRVRSLLGDRIGIFEQYDDGESMLLRLVGHFFESPNKVAQVPFLICHRPVAYRMSKPAFGNVMHPAPEPDSARRSSIPGELAPRDALRRGIDRGWVGTNPGGQCLIMNGMDYVVITKATEEGVSAWVPGLPGCWSEGATEDEALANVQEAITDYLAVAADLSSREAGAKSHLVHVSVA